MVDGHDLSDAHWLRMLAEELHRSFQPQSLTDTPPPHDPQPDAEDTCMPLRGRGSIRYIVGTAGLEGGQGSNGCRIITSQ
ncbi:hypothetical protein ABT084_01945 [Streptomyces sp. NPDC002138]|uniref:hypothetical protein n=1 Tax=Streptomyces sp. NPDC002138 TaxID=3154410 RepID=UPI003323A393